MIEEPDFQDTLQFFSRPLPRLLDSAASSLNNLDLTCTPTQKLDLVALFFDLVGTECLKEPVMLMQDTADKMPGAEKRESSPVTSVPSPGS